MTTFHFQTHVSDSGVITLPPEFYGRTVVVSLNEMQEDIDEADQPQTERRTRIAAERARIMDQTPEERRAAVEEFMKAWKGCLKGVPHMTAKEIRAERLEKKYGSEK